MNFGGYPRVVTESSAREKLQVINEIYQSYIDRDIRLFLQGDRPESYPRLIKLLAAQTGRILNLNSLANEAHLSVPSIRKYLWYAEKTYFIRLETEIKWSLLIEILFTFMNNKSKRRKEKTMSFKLEITSRVITLTLIVIVAMLVGACKKSNSDTQPPDGTSAKLRFVFLADSRGDSLGFPVDSAALNPIIREIDTLNPKPSFVVFGGDMCYRGYMNKEYTFQMFKNLFSKLINKGIPLYPAVGNHELYHEHASYGYFLVNQQNFQSTFNESPANGPAGYEHLAYSFNDQASSSFFAVMDCYYVTKDTQKINMGGHIDSTQMAWLKTQVAQTSALHKFLFIHVPYYYVDSDSTEASEADTTLTTLWSFIDANKFDFYACGHSHLYARRTIDGSLTPYPQPVHPVPAWSGNVVQLLCGTCGAGSGGGYIDPTVRTEWDVHNAKKTYYYTVIDVSGNTVTVNSFQGYTGQHTVFETFKITK